MEPITVFLADDTSIALHGWRAILQLYEDIHVVGESSDIQQVQPQIVALRPDIVLLDMKWGPDPHAGLSTLAELKSAAPQTGVVAVSAYDRLLTKAVAQGADAAIGKQFSIEQLVATIRAVHQKAPLLADNMHTAHLSRQAQDFAARLLSLSPGAQDARPYEQLMEQLLPFLFEDTLLHFRFWERHSEGQHIWDLVGFIGSDHPFWRTVQQVHHTTYALFELKNVGKTSVQHVRQLMAYLDDPPLSLGVLVGRNPATAGARAAAHRSLRQRNDVILILSDDDVLEMLRIRGEGGEPSDTLLRLYMDLVS